MILPICSENILDIFQNFVCLGQIVCVEVFGGYIDGADLFCLWFLCKMKPNLNKTFYFKSVNVFDRLNSCTFKLLKQSHYKNIFSHSLFQIYFHEDIVGTITDPRQTNTRHDKP